MPGVSLRRRVGGDSKPRPKQCPITSPDRPGPLVFQRATLKNWVGPGYEAIPHGVQEVSNNSRVHGAF